MTIAIVTVSVNDFVKESAVCLKSRVQRLYSDDLFWRILLSPYCMLPSIDQCSHFSLFVFFNDALQVNGVYCEFIERAMCSNPIYPQ
jgi:hypothetical protein